MKLLWRETTTVGFAKWVDKDQMYDMCRKNLVSSEEICVSVCSSEIISPSENCREWNISNLRHGSIKWSPRCTHIIRSWRIIFITYKVALSIVWQNEIRQIYDRYIPCLRTLNSLAAASAWKLNKARSKKIAEFPTIPSEMFTQM